MDLHHNLFYGYRGPNTDELDRERQLENNLTKALINMFSISGEAVWRPFVAELGLGGAPRDFLLQRRDVPGGAANKRHRVLLGITKDVSAWSPGGCAESIAASLPDAWVYGDGFAVLVESKVNGDFSPGQMQAHLELLRSVEGTLPKIELTTWKRIHRLFCSFLPSLKDVTSTLLVKQFIQFLEYSGMSGFTGFRREHFDYFVLHDDDDARRWVRDQVNEFATQVRAILHKSTRFYEEHDIGNLKLSDSYCWVAFGPSNGAYRKVTHQTISLAADGLRVFVNTELKAATDRLKNVVSHSGDAFRTAVQDLHQFEPFDLVLEERVQRQASLFDYTPKMRLHSSMLADKATSDVAWNAFTETVRLLPLPYFRIERLIAAFKLRELSECDPPEVVPYVVKFLESNHAVVKLLNE